MKVKKPNREEALRLEKSLVKMELELQTCYSEMGKSLLELADGEQKRIDALVDRIIETRKRLTAVQGEIRCPECMTYNTADSKFCRRCGSALTTHSRKENLNELER